VRYFEEIAYFSSCDIFSSLTATLGESNCYLNAQYHNQLKRGHRDNFRWSLSLGVIVFWKVSCKFIMPYATKSMDLFVQELYRDI
jgi:hypothetical protein